MRYLAIGDVHGCSRAFDQLLAIVRPQPEDVIITLGDYLNKGPDSKGVIERLIRLTQTHQLIPLKGNHEVQLLQARNHRFKHSVELQYLGIETLISYSLLDRELTLDNVSSTKPKKYNFSSLDGSSTSLKPSFFRKKIITPYAKRLPKVSPNSELRTQV